MPAAANQQPATNQAGTLDTARVTSNIPKAGTDDGAWVYPSPQMVNNVYHVIQEYYHFRTFTTNKIKLKFETLCYAISS